MAQNELGYLEKKSNSYLDDKTANAGSNNYTKYWRDVYAKFQKEAWCGCFVIWCFIKAYGEAEAKRLLCTAGTWSFYTPTEASQFKAKKQWYTSNPKIGDVIFFKNTQRIHHTGIVYKVDSQKVYTIEGNTSSANEVIPNGGGVYAKSYTIGNNNIAGYGRPDYKIENNIVDIPVSSGRAGLKIIGTSSLNIRSTPINGKVVGTYKENDLVQVFAKTRTADGTYWFKSDKGYISSKYVEGWVQEIFDNSFRWWYVMQGYTYPKSEFKIIDDKLYVFDEDGWMLTSERFNSDGSIHT